MQSFNSLVLTYKASHTPLVLATIMNQTGSAPRTAGARMLALPDGSIHGTIGGGKYEADAITAATNLLTGSLPFEACPQEYDTPALIMEFSLRGVTDMDMVCGGALTLLLEVVPDTIESLEVFQKAAEAEKKGQSFVFITTFMPFHETGVFKKLGLTGTQACVKRHVLVPQKEKDDMLFPALLEPIAAQAKKLATSNTQHTIVSQTQYLLELFPRLSRIFIFGAGHISQDVANLAASLDFLVTVLDDRPEFVNKERFPTAEAIMLPSLHEENINTFLQKNALSPLDGIVIVTRGHSFDKDALAAAVKTDAGYIGMIGSKTKREQVYNNLRHAGISESTLAKVHSPIGLAIGAETPREIAVSIVAELIQWKRNTL